MNETIQLAKDEFLRAKARIARSLETTPDDRLNWSPSPTARTPIQQVVHAANSVRFTHETWDGRTFAIPSPAEAESHFREIEKEFTTRQQAIDLLEQNSAAYVAWLDDLAPERLGQMIDLPFGMGQIPVGAGLGFMPQHVLWHAAQLDYIQTIYGDLDWHM